MDVAKELDSTHSSVSSLSMNEEESDVEIIRYVDIEKEIFKKADKSQIGASDRKHMKIGQVRSLYGLDKKKQIQINRSDDTMKTQNVSLSREKGTNVSHPKPVFFARRSMSSSDSNNISKKEHATLNTTSDVKVTKTKHLMSKGSNIGKKIVGGTYKPVITSLISIKKPMMSGKISSETSGPKSILRKKVVSNALPLSENSSTKDIKHINSAVQNKSKKSSLLKSYLFTQNVNEKAKENVVSIITKEELLKNILNTPTTDGQLQKETKSPSSECNKDDTVLSEIPNLNNIEIIESSDSGEEDADSKPLLKSAPQKLIGKFTEPDTTTKSVEKSFEQDCQIIFDDDTTKCKSLASYKSTLSSKLSLDTSSEHITPKPLKSPVSNKSSSFKAIAPKVDKNKFAPILISQSAVTVNSATSISDLPNKDKTSVDSKKGGKLPPGSTSAITPQPGLLLGSSIPTSINFVVPREEIIRCKQSNAPLILAVPPMIPIGSSQPASGAMGNLLMVLPNQLPDNLPPQGSVNFMVSTTATPKGNMLVQNLAKGASSNSCENVASSKMPNITAHFGKVNLQGIAAASKSTSSSSHVISIRERNKTNEAEEVSDTAVHKILNTKEKDGPNLCWYASKTGKRDLNGFLYKDPLGFSKSEVLQAKRCLRKLSAAIYKKQIALDQLGSQIVSLKRGYKCKSHAPNINILQKFSRTTKSKRERSPESIIDLDDNKKVKFEQPFSKKAFEEKDPFKVSSTFQDDDDGSDLYYTKKVVILRNKPPNLTKRGRKLKRRLPKIKLRMSRRTASLKQKLTSPTLPIKQCSVILERDQRVEEEFKKHIKNLPLEKQTNLDNTGRPSRKRRLDLESMGLIKKVRRRNAIDSPNIPNENETQQKGKSEKSLVKPSKSNVSEESDDTESYIIGKKSEIYTETSTKKSDLIDSHKSTQTEMKKGVFMSYREYLKITKLSQTEINFIFILNTIQSLEDLRINEHKPLLILDRFNYKFDFDHITHFNVLFTRDDGEIIPTQLLKNFEFVYFVKCGVIKVVSRPVLCKFILERNDVATKSVKKSRKDVKLAATESSIGKNKTTKKENEKDKFAKTLSLRRKPPTQKKSDTTGRGSVINVRQDLMQPTPSTSSLSQSKFSPAKSQLSKNTHTSRDKLNKTVDTERKKYVDTMSSLAKKESTSNNLDMKFHEIESNLSIMFGKSKTSDTSRELSSVINLKQQFEEINKIQTKNTADMGRIASELAADLDYLFSNSAEENTNLENSSEETKIDIVAHTITETDTAFSKSLVESPKKSLQSLSMHVKEVSKEKSDLSTTMDVTNDLTHENIEVQNVQPDKSNANESKSLSYSGNKRKEKISEESAVLENECVIEISKISKDASDSGTMAKEVSNENASSLEKFPKENLNNPEIFETRLNQPDDTSHIFSNKSEDDSSLLPDPIPCNKSPDQHFKCSEQDENTSGVSEITGQDENPLGVPEISGQDENTSGISEVTGQDEETVISKITVSLNKSSVEGMDEVEESASKPPESNRDQSNIVEEIVSNSDTLTEVAIVESTDAFEKVSEVENPSDLSGNEQNGMTEEKENGESTTQENEQATDISSEDITFESLRISPDKVNTYSDELENEKNKNWEEDTQKTFSQPLDVDQFLSQSSDSIENTVHARLDVDQFLSKDVDISQTNKVDTLDSSRDFLCDELTTNQNSDQAVEMDAEFSQDCQNPNPPMEIDTHFIEDSNIIKENLGDDCTFGSTQERSKIVDQIASVNSNSDKECSEIDKTENVKELPSIDAVSTALHDVINEEMGHTSEFDVFHNTAGDKAEGVHTTQSSSIFDQSVIDTNTNIVTSPRKDDTEHLLSNTTEIDADLGLHTNEISKNLPDDYLEK